MDDYNQLILRNRDYVDSDLQQRIRNTRLLIAGCGIGSTFAEAAVRLGFEQLTLVDADTVGTHNLNRQDYLHADVGAPKVDALARRLTGINPAADVRAVNALITDRNVADLVDGADIVFDTIDFLDLPAIVALHDECNRVSTPIITALAVGWGAGCIYFPRQPKCTFRDIFELPANESVDHLAYSGVFAGVIRRLEERLDADVVKAVRNALTIMEDGTPCPASQVAPGAMSVGALAATLVVSILEGREVLQAPEMIVLDPRTVISRDGLNVMEPASAQ